jgi:hemoglobin
MLDHRPKLQDGVKMHLDAAAKMEPAKGAFELRTALDDIQNDIAPPKGKTPMVTTLWDRLGGEKGVKAIVHDIVLVAAEDKKVDFLRGGKVKLDAKGIEHLEKMLVEFISSATGGPLKYEGKSMKEAHKGMMIADVEFDALVADMVSVLMKHKVAPADIAELGKIVESTRKEIVEKK